MLCGELIFRRRCLLSSEREKCDALDQDGITVYFGGRTTRIYLIWSRWWEKKRQAWILDLNNCLCSKTIHNWVGLDGVGGQVLLIESITPFGIKNMLSYFFLLQVWFAIVTSNENHIRSREWGFNTVHSKDSLKPMMADHLIIANCPGLMVIEVCVNWYVWWL